MDGVVLDEVAQMPPKMWTEVIRPALSDRKGFMVAIGTPQGHNSFFELYNHGLQDENWYAKSFKASETNIVDKEELEEAKKMMPPEIYEAEYECSFESSAIGSIYSQSLSKADNEGRVTKVPYDSTIKVDTYWDLGNAR